MTFKKIKGTTDYYPEKQFVQDTIYSKFKEIAKSYGFEHVEPPVLEKMELLTAKSGDEIKEQIFPIEKKSDEEMGLRFEFTSSIARMFVQKQKTLAKPVKWLSFNKAWRYERPQLGREREFFQFNAEIIGTPRVEADAELINMAIECLRALGLTKDDFFVKINNRKLLQGILMGYVEEGRLDKIIKIIDKRAKITQQQFEKELRDAGAKNVEKIQEILDMDMEKIGEVVKEEPAKTGYNELKLIKDLLPEEFIKFDISVARGLDYYTGTVFEIFDSKEELRSLCGGGRYDNMIEIFGGEKCPATGFGIGYSTVRLFLEKKGILPDYKEKYDYFVACVSDEYRNESIKIANKMRKNNSVLVDLMGRGLSKQLKYANAKGVKEVVFVGEEEYKKGYLKIKNMETGEEREIKISQILNQ